MCRFYFVSLFVLFVFPELCLHDEGRNRGVSFCRSSLWILHILRNDGFTLVEVPQVALGAGSFLDAGSGTVTPVT